MKWSLVVVLSILALITVGLYASLRASLPSLSGHRVSAAISAPTSLSRDILGVAVITAATQSDSAYALGYAHAQDRLFQMDLLRRQAAGELSQLVGERALEVDKKHRIHQFRQRSEQAYKRLSVHEQKMLVAYTAGVNDGAQSLSLKPYEYLLTNASFAPWLPVDSLLASYSMYIDLQLAQTEYDFGLTALNNIFGPALFHFFTLPSRHQAAIDGSLIPTPPIDIPSPPPVAVNANAELAFYNYASIPELPDYGSNNWAVSGVLTPSQSAMLSNDMHLGLSVPAIWYKAQLNYTSNQQSVTVTGVSLPGTPAIIVGSNGHIAWGFTNSNIDSVDWIELNSETNTHEVTETILTPSGSEQFTFEMSEFGPVKTFNGKRYALKWIAHQPYAVNVRIADLAKMTSIEEALNTAKKVRIPVQNMVIADSKGDIAWQLIGAISQRKPLARQAIAQDQYSPLWEQEQLSPANMIKPQNNRVWSANARVIGVSDLPQFGDGGYALGARQLQIAKLLMQKEQFSETDFYQLQLNNEAWFLQPWHQLLVETLSHDRMKYQSDIDTLNAWGACACSDSIGYTLVRRFRSTVINQLLAPVNTALEQYGLSASPLLRAIEPAIWAIIDQQASDWLPQDNTDFTAFYLSAYNDTKTKLHERFGSNNEDLSKLNWGNVNALSVTHPFSSTLGVFSMWVNMPRVIGYGDSYLPAVQSRAFGASQRLIVRPGDEQYGILTVPGGQSGHFMSPYYKDAFIEYASNASTPLLPQKLEHEIVFTRP